MKNLDQFPQQFHQFFFPEDNLFVFPKYAIAKDYVLSSYWVLPFFMPEEEWNKFNRHFRLVESSDAGYLHYKMR